MDSQASTDEGRDTWSTETEAMDVIEMQAFEDRGVAAERPHAAKS
jgi:hypothetical protein